jgi:hypothetical protein
MDGSPRRRAARGSAGLIARTRPPGTGPSAAARIVRRTALAVVLATALAAVAGEAVLRAMLPALSLSLQRLAPDFSLISLAVGTGPGMSLRADVTLARAVVSGERVYWPDPRGRATASTPAGHALLPPLVIAIALSAWPPRRLREYPLRAALACPPAAALVMLDTPAVLIASVWSTFPEPRAGALTGMWAAFLQTGGRFALALTIAGLTIAVAARLSKGRDRPSELTAA